MNKFSDNARIARAYAAERSYGDPSRDMRVVGITGTNGKTTTVHLVAAIMTYAGQNARALGTINSPLTTLGEPELAQALAGMRDEGVEVVAMEVSSHGLAQHRVDGVHFDVTAFSNLTQDHLDYHKDMEEYFDAKKRLFFDLKSDSSVINRANDPGKELADAIGIKLPQRNLIAVGTADALIRDENTVESAAGTSFDLAVGDQSYPVTLPLVGEHNVSNALLAAGCAYALGVEGRIIAEALTASPQVAGRLQRVETDQLLNVFVDYAHTPDALEHALGSLRGITPGKLGIVFGCGGDRDKTKRPLMGRVAVLGADHIIVTTDNPRSEDPQSIINDILSGMDIEHSAVCISEVDRAKAIEKAIIEAAEGDTILIAGKGHETYQIFADETIDFDDAQVAREALARRCVGRE